VTEHIGIQHFNAKSSVTLLFPASTIQLIAIVAVRHEVRTSFKRHKCTSQMHTTHIHRSL